jgi:hypothetical protein
VKLKLILFFPFVLLFSTCSSLSEKNTRYISSETKLITCTSGLSEVFGRKFFSTTVGTEFEGAFPAQLSFYDIAKLIETKLKEKFPDANVILKEIDHQYSESEYQVILGIQGDESTFTVKTDSTLSFDNPEIKGIEITSHIMTSQKDIDLYLEVLESIRPAGVSARADVGGIHFHFGLPASKTYAELEPLYQLFVKAQDSLIRYFKVHPGRQYHKSSNLNDALMTIQQIVKNTPHKTLDNLNVGELNRRTMLRILLSLRTWEVRFFNSTLDPEINLFYQDFLERLFSRWLENDPTLLEFISNNEKIETSDLLELLGFDLKVTDELMERLTKESESLEEGLPFIQSLKNFWKNDDSNSKLAQLEAFPTMVMDLILRDQRFLGLPTNLQEKVLKRGSSKLRSFHQLWRGETKRINLFNDEKDKVAFFHIFHQYLRLNPKVVDILLDQYERSVIIGFFRALIKDFIKHGQISRPSNSRKLSASFVKLLTKATYYFKPKEIQKDFFPLLNLIKNLSYPPRTELTEFADTLIEKLLKLTKGQFDNTSFLSFLNKLKLNIKKKVELAKLIQENIDPSEFEYDLFYQYINFTRSYPDELINDDSIIFITSVTRQNIDSISNDERVNLILTFKDFLHLELTEIQKKNIDEILVLLRNN